jgi:hypothetical protein
MIKQNKNHTTAEYVMRSVLILLLIGWCCLSFGEKSLYFYKGYIFKHPFFENKSLYTTQNSVEVVAADNFFNLKPKAITYSGNDKTAVGVYLSGDSIYVFSTNLVPDACNNNRLVCTEPKYLATGSVFIDSTTAIYAVKSTATDVVKLCVSSSGGRVYIFSIEIATLSISSRDSITLSSASGRTISSISGNSTSFKTPDSQIWVTGSNGLLRSIRIGLALKDSVFDLAVTENVRCFGSSLAGTASGSVFERKGNTFEKVYSVSGAIRTISTSGLAGDGVVSVKTASGWAGIIQGSSGQYRECLVSANGSGALYEVIDELWGIDTIHGTNSNTQISSITPDSFMKYVNTSSKYSYDGQKNDTLRIKLSDFEKNYQPLSIVLSNGGTSKEIGTVNYSSGTQLSNSDPSRECIAGKISLADSVIQIVLSNQVSVSASVLIAKDNIVCLQCMQTSNVVKNEAYWGYKSELTIRSSTQTMVIVNDKGAVTSLLNANHQNSQVINICKDKHHSSITLPAGDEIKGINVFDLSGKRISSLLSGNNIKIENTGSGIITVQIQLKSGKVISTHTVLTQR